MREDFSLIRRLSQIGTWLDTLLGGVRVGRDARGNRYYRARRTRKGLPERRWVLYAGEPEASKVPPEWHGWLHHTHAAPLDPAAAPSWRKPHLANPTGTSGALLPRNTSKDVGVVPWTPCAPPSPSRSS